MFDLNRALFFLLRNVNMCATSPDNPIDLIFLFFVSQFLFTFPNGRAPASREELFAKLHSKKKALEKKLKDDKAIHAKFETFMVDLISIVE